MGMMGGRRGKGEEGEGREWRNQRWEGRKNNTMYCAKLGDDALLYVDIGLQGYAETRM